MTNETFPRPERLPRESISTLVPHGVSPQTLGIPKMGFGCADCVACRQRRMCHTRSRAKVLEKGLSRAGANWKTDPQSFDDRDT